MRDPEREIPRLALAWPIVDGTARGWTWAADSATGRVGLARRPIDCVMEAAGGVAICRWQHDDMGDAARDFHGPIDRPPATALRRLCAQSRPGPVGRED